MANEIVFGEKTYISSKRASELSDYSQDYIGQLARAGSIEARRVGGLWYVLLDSLEGHSKQASEYAPVPPHYSGAATTPESAILFDGSEYISAARASEITGYNQDYVGQLARAGKIGSRQVGKRWFVKRDDIAIHKAEKDASLGAVQAESVGILRSKEVLQEEPKVFFTYTAGLDPAITLSKEERSNPIDIVVSNQTLNTDNRGEIDDQEGVMDKEIRQEMPFFAISQLYNRNLKRTLLSVSVVAAVVVLSVGFASFKSHSLYALVRPRVNGAKHQLAATALVSSDMLGRFAEQIERLLGRELSYTRQ
jgi:hypothetical protein